MLAEKALCFYSDGVTLVSTTWHGAHYVDQAGFVL